MPEEEIGARVARLAKERGMSATSVRYLAYDPAVKGTSPETIKSAIQGRRPLRPVHIEAVAKVLQVPPETFPEYRLALARTMLDEREVGLDQALEALTRFEAALQSAEPVSHREAQRTAASRRRAPRDASEPRTRKAE